MIEVTVYKFLKRELDIPVYTLVPTAPPKEYVVIQRTGGTVENFIKSATFALQSYSDSLAGAMKLNERVKDAMDRLIETDSVSKSKLNSDYNFTDTTKKNFRYQAVYDLVYTEE